MRRRLVRPKIVWPAWPALMVLEEKHGDTHFLIRSEAEVYAHALAILKARYKAKNYYFEPKPKPIDLTEENIKALPESLRQDAQKKLQIHNDAVWRYEADKQISEELQKALKDEDGKLAWETLLLFVDSEYENIRLEPFDEVKKYRA